MARDLSASFVTAIQAGTIRPVLFYQGEFEGGTLRFWSGVGSITWNGQTWLGAGNLIGISPVEETSDVRAIGIECSLSGMDSSILALAISGVRQGKKGLVWLGLLDANEEIIADPFLAFSGRVDVPRVTDEGKTGSITVTYESRLIDLDKTRERRYTHEDQQIDYAGDLGFEYVAALQDAELTWGKGRTVPATAPPAPVGGGESSGIEAGESGGFGGSDGGFANSGPAELNPGSIYEGTDFGGGGTSSGFESAAAEQAGGYEGTGFGGEAGGGGGGGGKIICSELRRQGLLDDATWEADELYGRLVARTDPALRVGYLVLARPVVRLMARSPIATRVVAAGALPWAREMAFRMGAVSSGSRAGAIITAIGEPICRTVGNLYLRRALCA